MLSIFIGVVPFVHWPILTINYMKKIVYVTSQNVHKTYWHQTILGNVLCVTYAFMCVQKHQA